MALSVPRSRATGLRSGRATRERVSPLAQCIQLVADELHKSERHLQEMLLSSVPAVGAIGRYLADSGGKRLRPLLTALAARAAGHTGDISRLMCAGELLHLGSLLHDDVVDDALERRGQRSAHLVFGNAGVILTGDVCLARSVQVAAEEGGHDAVLALTRVVAEMSEGEVIQLLNRSNLALPRAVYHDIIERKSAALISWCAAAGAWASGNEAAVEGLAQFGRAVGTAFQITDDVLDYAGQSAVTGKQVGRDLVERKVTLPLLLAFERDPLLASAVANSTDKPEEVAILVRRVVATGAPALALEAAREHVAQGIDALHRATPESAYRSALEALAHHLVDRVK
ncbi:MAG: farnesyltranstransferase [Deltaproteobacteria bacterium]|nr:farnesyltranstransferase [Deltaproteobacteria bacterium]HCH61274.1 farnesyltranstransferase [Deltaproteobacteria bacterium]